MKRLHNSLPALVIAAAVVLVFVIVGVTGGASTATKPRLERSLTESFTNRYLAQAKLVGKTGITARSLDARADCDKGGPKVKDVGPGADWICQVSWKDPARPLPDGSAKFDLNVHSNNCYTAGGQTKYVGVLTILDKHGRDVPNPLFEWDACFDPASSNRPNNVVLKPAFNPPPSAKAPPPAGPPATPSTLQLPAGGLHHSAQVVDLPLMCVGGKSDCEGTIKPTFNGRNLPTITFAVAAASTGIAHLQLTKDEASRGGSLDLRVDTTAGTPMHVTRTLTVR